MLIISVFIIGAVVADQSSSTECPAVLKAAGVSDMFAPMIAHSVHSLTLEDIRYFFDADATEENGIPTVNMDLLSDTRVLPNAPLIGYDDDFSTMGMKAFDLVMRNMNRTWWGITNYNTLETLLHAYHMAEIWDKTAEKYKTVARLLDPESEICACMTDVENNDVLNYMNLLAFKIRYPGITSGNKTITDQYIEQRKRRSAAYRIAYDLSLQAAHFRSLDFDGFDFDLPDVELLGDIAEKLVDNEEVISQHIDSSEHWEFWKNLIKQGMDESGFYDLAVFLFCTLN